MRIFSHADSQKLHRSSLILGVVAVALITLFSTSSPIYPLNPWDDSNIFMTIGRSMLHGKVLYKDVFDQKGPLIFYLHEIAACISEKSFLGIYLFQILSIFTYLYFSDKIMRLFTSEPITIPLTVTMGLLMITSDFYFYGDSVEEFVLPMLTFSLYLMLKYIKTNVMPTNIELISFGICIGLILWTKFTILVFYAGAFVALALWTFKHNKGREFLGIIGLVSVGICAVSLAVIGLSLADGNTSEMMTSYWYENLFEYNNVNTNNAPTGLWFQGLKLGICAVLITPFLLMRVRNDVKWIVTSCFFSLLLLFTLFSVQIYYFLVVYAFAPLIVYFFRKRTAHRLMYILISIFSLMAVASDYSLIQLLQGTFPDKVIAAADIINHDQSKNKNVIIYSSHETGIYLLTGQLPMARYFFVPNLEIPELISEQKALAQDSKVKYLIQKTDNMTGSDLYYNIPIPENYTKIYDNAQKYRYLFLINPKMFLWNLGYTQCLLRHIMTPESFKEHIILYRKTMAID